MRNFRTLYFYELKKILQKKVVWITWGIIFVLVVLMGISDIIFYSQGEDEPKTNAYEAMVNKREDARALSGRKIDDSLLDEMQRAVSEKSKKYDAVYQIVEQLKKDHEAIMHISAEELYQTRTDQVASLFYSQKLTEGETAYWQEKEAALGLPFTYEYADGYRYFIDFLYNIQFFMVMFIGVSLSGVFAEEHLLRTDQIVLGSRYGKKMLYFAKLGAGAAIGIGSTAVLLTVGAVLSLAVFGTDGFHGAVQLVVMQSSSQLSVGETALCLLVLLLLIAGVYSILTMFLSEGLKNSTAAIAFIAGTFILTYFLNIPYQRRILHQILRFTPAKLMQANSWAELGLIRIFGTYFTSYQFAPVLYLTVIVILILMGKRIYERFQAGGR